MKLSARIVLFLLAWSLISSIGPAGMRASETGPVRDYWPTLGWRTSTPAEQGMDRKRLESLFKGIGRRKVDGIVVTRHGYLVAEKYWGQYGPEVPHPIFSCTKSVASTLIGIAREQGFIRSVDQPLAELFPEWAAEGVDPRKKAVTLKHVLTMTLGSIGPKATMATPTMS